MSEIKLIATDLDGTFFCEGYYIPEENLRAVKLAQQAGIKVCACSARLWGMGGTMVKMGGFEHLAVFNNGAAIANAETGEIVYKAGIAPEYFRAIIEAISSFDAVVQSWNHDFIGLYGPTMGEQGKMTIQRFGDPSSKVRCDVIVYNNLEEMDLGCRDVAQKIMLSMDNREIPKVVEKLSGICELEVTSSNPRVIEITMPNATKGLGLAQLAGMYGIAPENVLAIGDSHNDVGMLEFAGVKVAVGNAEESLKHVAQHVVARNVEGGFAQAVHDLALKG